MDREFLSISLGVPALLKDGADGFCLLLGLGGFFSFFFYFLLLLGCWVQLCFFFLIFFTTFGLLGFGFFFPPFNCALTLFFFSGLEKSNLAGLARIFKGDFVFLIFFIYSKRERERGGVR
jgi:hypothetical protein